MNYYGAKELSDSFLTVRNNTIAIAQDIPESEYAYRAAADLRTVGQTLVHIAIASQFQEEIHGANRLHSLATFDFPNRMKVMHEEMEKPRSKEEIIKLLQENGERFSKFLSSLSDELLAERIEFRPGAVPPSKTRFEMILGVKEHEMHHRAQLMLIERLLGITPHMTRQMQERFAAMQRASAEVQKA